MAKTAGRAAAGAGAGSDDLSGKLKNILQHSTESRKTEEERAEYMKYNELQDSKLSFSVFSILTALTFCSFIGAKLYYTATARSLGSLAKLNAVALTFEFILLTALLVLIVLKLSSWGSFFSLSKAFRDSVKSFSQTIFIIFVTAYIGFMLNAKVQYGPCDSDRDTIASFYCNGPGNVLPADMLVALSVVPMAFYFVARDTRYEVVVFCWIISVAALFTTLAWLSISAVFGAVFIYTFATFMIYYETHRRHLAVYLLTRKLQKTLRENEKLADETHANEMRAMIANVAHDLKTPLTSFLSGVDFISNLLEDCEDSLCSTVEGEKIFQDTLEPMRGCLSSIQNTNAFMVMTINRCIDYTKASKGMKLIPKPETIDLREVLNLPLRVMRDMQQRLEITLDDSVLDSAVCSHVITDKQWLQENLLCLLSNAVKYSSKGKVEISISLVKEALVRKKTARRKKRLKAVASVVSKFGISLGREAPDSNNTTGSGGGKSSSSHPSGMSRAMRRASKADLVFVPQSPSILDITAAKLVMSRFKAKSIINSNSSTSSRIAITESTSQDHAYYGSESRRNMSSSNSNNNFLTPEATAVAPAAATAAPPRKTAGIFRSILYAKRAAKRRNRPFETVAEETETGFDEDEDIEGGRSATNVDSGASAITTTIDRLKSLRNVAGISKAIQEHSASEASSSEDDDDDEGWDDADDPAEAVGGELIFESSNGDRAHHAGSEGNNNNNNTSTSNNNSSYNLRQGLSKALSRVGSSLMPSTILNHTHIEGDINPRPTSSGILKRNQSNASQLQELPSKSNHHPSVKFQEEQQLEQQHQAANFENRATPAPPPMLGNPYNNDNNADNSGEDDIPMVLRFEVQDSGIGLSDEAMKNLFNPFKQAQRLAGGTGLGLYSLAKRLEALKGYYGVHRRKDGQQGSVFWFAIVYRPDKVSAAMHERSKSKLKDFSATFAPPPAAPVIGNSALSAMQNVVKNARLLDGKQQEHNAPVTSSNTVTTTTSVDIGTSANGDEEEKEAELKANAAQQNQYLGDLEDQIRALTSNPSMAEAAMKPLATATAASTSAAKSNAASSNNKSSSGSSKRHAAATTSGAPAVPAVSTSIPSTESPLVSPHLSPHLSPPSLRSSTKTTLATGVPAHMEVLLVDDAISILKMTTMMLKRKGHIITQAENGAEALDKIFDRFEAVNKPFDVVVMDLQMPVMDGLEAVRRLRQKESTMSAKLTYPSFSRKDALPQVSTKTRFTMDFNEDQTFSHSVKQASKSNKIHQIVIGCSANSDHETMQEALKAGVDAFMSKPFTLDTFYDIIEQLKQVPSTAE